jgi:hypothetical protein
MKKQITVTPKNAPALCVELAGGGYTERQTARAMQFLHTLTTTGHLSIKGYNVTLKEAQ